MKLFIKCLPRLFHNARKDIYRHFSLTISSVLSITLTLLMMALMLVIAANVEQFASNIEDEFIIQVSINPTLDEQKIKDLQNEIEKLSDVDTVTYSTKEEQMDELVETNGSIFSKYQGENNPLYDIFTVTLKNQENIEKVKDKIINMSGVSDASYGGSTFSKVIQLFSSMRTGGMIFIGLLVLLSIFLIRNTIKTSIQVRKEEIAIMRQVGAYNWYISFPFAIQGMIIGIYGSILPILLLGIGYPILYKSMHGVFMTDMLVMTSPLPFIFYLCIGLLAMGILVGSLGSFLAARKYLRWVR